MHYCTVWIQDFVRLLFNIFITFFKVNNSDAWILMKEIRHISVAGIYD